MWRKQTSQDYLPYWSVGFFFGSAGWLINLIPVERFSSEQLFWLIDISITLISVSAVTYGFFIRSFKSFNALWFFAAGFIALHWIAYFSSIKIDYGLKMAVSPLYVAVCMQIIVYIMWLKNKRFSSLEWAAALLCQVSALVHLGRAYLYSKHISGTENILFSAYDLVSFLVLPAVYTATGAALMLLVFNDKQTTDTPLVNQTNGILDSTGLQKVSGALMWQCECSKQWVSVIACRVNHLKYIKQHYGHAISEKILLTLANSLSENVGNRGYVASIDNQDFLILLAMTDETEADKWATKLQLMASQLKIDDRQQNVPVTLAVGQASSCKNYDFEKLKSRSLAVLNAR